MTTYAITLSRQPTRCGCDSAEYGRYYRIKYDESTKHKHKRALVLTARKLVRLVDAMLRHNQLYVPQPRDSAKEVNKQPIPKGQASQTAPLPAN